MRVRCRERKGKRGLSEGEVRERKKEDGRQEDGIVVLHSSGEKKHTK